jgi:tellurite resistance protein TerC
VSVGIEVWLAFGAGVVALVLIDLLVLNRHADTVSLRSASRSTAAFVTIAIAFGALLAVTEGSGPAGQFYAGYLLELSLSIDNVFVWALIFSAFSVPEQYQRRVLFWGILFAFALRGAFIAAGSQLLAQFEWIVYVFGALLLWSAIRILRQDDADRDPRESRVYRAFSRLVPTTDRLYGQRLLVRPPEDEQPRRRPLPGGFYATPLLAVLAMIEGTDLIFALDSIPAIFGVTREPFLVFSATALAMLGLRSMYFVLAGAVRRFEYLNTGLAIILAFVGIRFMLEDVVHVPTGVSLAGAVGASVLKRP